MHMFVYGRGDCLLRAAMHPGPGPAPGLSAGASAAASGAAPGPASDVGLVLCSLFSLGRCAVCGSSRIHSSSSSPACGRLTQLADSSAKLAAHRHFFDGSMSSIDSGAVAAHSSDVSSGCALSGAGTEEDRCYGYCWGSNSEGKDDHSHVGRFSVAVEQRHEGMQIGMRIWHMRTSPGPPDSLEPSTASPSML